MWLLRQATRTGQDKPLYRLWTELTVMAQKTQTPFVADTVHTMQSTDHCQPFTKNKSFAKLGRSGDNDGRRGVP
jgi:hypothetical protein